MPESILRRAWNRLAPAEPGEGAALAWSFAYFFLLLCSYYILRPLRDEMGIAGGVRELPWVFTGTFLAMLAAVPLFGWCAARFPRRRLLPVLVAFQVARRAGDYAVMRPAREVLYTVVGRETKYKAKNFIDTVVYRGGDAVSGWAFAGLKALGLGLTGIAVVAVPIALAWAWLGLRLGRRQEALRDSLTGAQRGTGGTHER